MRTTVKGIVTATFIAVLLIVGNAKATELKALKSASIEIEETLQLENWMTNEKIWNSNFVKVAEFVVETEPGLELENWMTNSEVWNANNSFVEEVEMEMELEGWMTNDETWNSNKSYVEELETEPGMELENWMTNDNIWNTLNNGNTEALKVKPCLMD